MNPGDTFAAGTLINGRYSVLRKLGEGGMGSVHLVADTLEEDRLLALKTVRGELFEEQGDQRLRDEFEAMAQLRHPNVAEVYDFGSIDATGDHFFTMEFIDGRNLRDASADASYLKIYKYAAQICRALAYIHAQGFIHFDLKPDNIMVDASGVVKVMDFGLVGKGSFFQARILQGTAAYIAPEMIAGLPIDNRLDLYSLGAILFRVVTGRHLFGGITTVEVLWRHLEEAPNLTDDLARPLPAPLRPILERLLSKKPEARYSSATEVLTDIERILDEEEQRHPESPDRVAMGSRFVGRKAQLDELKSVFQRRVIEAAPGAPSLCLVMGESGMGKSRLIQEIRYHAQLSGARFLQGSCLQNGGQPYQPFAEILRSLIREILAGPSSARADSSIPPPSSSTDNPLAREGPPLLSGDALPVRSLLDFAGTLGADAGASAPNSVMHARRFDASAVTFIAPESSVSSSEPPRSSSRHVRASFPRAALQAAVARIEEHAAALSMLVPDDEDLRALAAAAPLPGKLQSRDRERLLSSVCSFFVDISLVRPLALYCSDLQWADELTVDLLSRLSRAARAPSSEGAVEAAGEGGQAPRLALYGCLRGVDIAGTRLDKTAQRMAAEGSLLMVPLAPLDRSDINEMLQAMLGRVDISDEALDILVERTGGNPLAVEVTVQEALERRAIVRSGASWIVAASALRGELAPATVAQALDRTLVRLVEPDAAVLRLLAIFNRPVSAMLLREVGAGEGAGTGAAGGGAGIGGGPVTDGYLAQILSRLRRSNLVQRGWAEGRYHYSIRHAQLRDRVYSAIDPAERALLHERAGAAMERLFPGQGQYLEDIAQHFRRAGNLEKASRSMRAAADQARRVHDLTRAAALYGEAYDILEMLPATSERLIDKTDLAVAIAEVSLYTPSQRSLERLQEALAVASEIGDPARLARVHNGLGRAYYTLGRNPESIRCFQEVLRLTEGTDDEESRALPFSVLGRVHVFMGRFEEARDYLTRAVALLRGQPGSEDELAYALGMLASPYLYSGDFARAHALTDESLAIAETIRHSMRISQAQISRGIAYAIQGEWSAARDTLERALDACRAVGNLAGLALGSSFLGLTYLVDGHARRAVELCSFGRDHIAAAGGTWTFSMIGSHLTEALLAAGKADEALRVAEETVPVVEGGERWGEVQLYTALGRVHAQRGERSEARRAFQRAIGASEIQKSPVFEAKSRLAAGAFLLSIGEHRAGIAQLIPARRAFETYNMYWYLARALAILSGSGNVGPCP